MSVELYTECLPELVPLELVKYSKLGMLSLAGYPQIIRDRFAHALITTADEQVMAALELGDTNSAKNYSRAARFVHKNIARYGNGGTDFMRMS